MMEYFPVKLTKLFSMGSTPCPSVGTLGVAYRRQGEHLWVKFPLPVVARDGELIEHYAGDTEFLRVRLRQGEVEQAGPARRLFEAETPPPFDEADVALDWLDGLREYLGDDYFKVSDETWSAMLEGEGERSIDFVNERSGHTVSFEVRYNVVWQFAWRYRYELGERIRSLLGKRFEINAKRDLKVCSLVWEGAERVAVCAGSEGYRPLTATAVAQFLGVTYPELCSASDTLNRRFESGTDKTYQ